MNPAMDDRDITATEFAASARAACRNRFRVDRAGFGSQDPGFDINAGGHGQYAHREDSCADREHG